MNEQVARDVVLVRAIETTDRKREILSEDDRMYASRSARELAQWQAADSKSPVTAEHFLQQRAEQIIKRLAERTPAFAVFFKRHHGLHALAWLLPSLALILGAALDRIADPHRVDLLSAPLLLIVGWNLLVYLGMLIWLCIPGAHTGRVKSGWLRRLSVGKDALPRKLPHALSAALLEFMSDWSQLSARLNAARLARTIHLSAALFALGAALSLYARGLLSQYAVGWESTFLDGAQVHALLSVLFAPAMTIFPLQGFTLAEIDALRFGGTPSAAGGARWVHLYAATLFLLVMLPRGALSLLAGWKARRLAAHFPLDLEQPYFRALHDSMGGDPGVMRVLPYSFTVDEARAKGLPAVAAGLLGERASVRLAPALAYGEEPREQLANIDLDDKEITLTAVLFNLAATPEAENHGALLDHLVRAAPRGLTVLIDESGFAARAGSETRVAERIALWRQFCTFHKAHPLFVNLLQPQAEAP